MAGSVQRLQGIKRVNFFGVRHLSPAASWHLLRLLEGIKPKCVLIEGPSDADSLIGSITRQNVVPPIAILAYTDSLPVETVLYPFAEYSPEYQALRWAARHGAESHFIDLPTSLSIPLHKFGRDKDEEDGDQEDGADREEDDQYIIAARAVYQGLTKEAGEQQYDSYWERNFEHNLNENVYNEALTLQSAEMRAELEPAEAESRPYSNAVDLVREAFMLRQIHKSLETYAPEEILVVTGAYHAKRMRFETEPMAEGEWKDLPQRETRLTLMPYSFYRLSSRSGYGAGNAAPGYFQMMWEHMREEQLNEFPAAYVSKLGRYIRENGGYCSTASVLETVRLGFALTSLKGGALPTLADLHDASVACIGHGSLSEVAQAFAAVDIGSEIGSLPEGLSQTPVQDDMNRELRRLKLDSYKSAVALRLDLDLRENIKVQSREAAFIDLSRSTFLHRLAFLGIGFAEKLELRQDGATWRESWALRWTPEVEIQVVEAVLLGETIELAAAFLLKEQLDECTDILAAARLIAAAYTCQLAGGVENALVVLQAIAADAGGFCDTAGALRELSMLIRYGDVRKADTQPLVPLMQQLFLRACLTLSGAASCDDKAAAEVAAAVGIMQMVADENEVDGDEWVKALWDLALRDDKNAKLSGLAFAVLLERNLVADEMCEKEVNRRLSPGVPAELGAGWFEGMSLRNRYALLSRVGLWRELDSYIRSLDDDGFKRSVVFMRRAFGSFEPREKNGVAELLADLWGLDATTYIQGELDEEETTALAELNDFDFDI